jgi:hypothetical protein
MTHIKIILIGLFCIQDIWFVHISEPPPPLPLLSCNVPIYRGFHRQIKLFTTPPPTAFLFCSMKIFFPTRFAIESGYILSHRLNMELDLQSLFGLHVHSCTRWLKTRNPPPHPPARGGYWWAKIDDISLWPPWIKWFHTFTKCGYNSPIKMFEDLHAQHRQGQF